MHEKLTRNRISSISRSVLGHYLSSELLDEAENAVIDHEDLFIFLTLTVDDNEEFLNAIRFEELLAEFSLDKLEVWPEDVESARGELIDGFFGVEVERETRDLNEILIDSRLRTFIAAISI